MIGLRNDYNYRLSQIFFMIALFLLNYDGLPFLNYANYRPSAVFPLLVCFLISIIYGVKFGKDDKCLILFIAVSIIHSCVSGVYYDDMYASLKHVITLFVALFTYISAKKMLADDNMKTAYVKVLAFSMVFPIIMGILQGLYFYNLGGPDISEITQLFTHIHGNRINMVSQEPSYAGIHLLTIGSIIFYYSFIYTDKKMLSLFIIMCFMFLFLFSIYTFAVLFLALFIFGILDKRYRRKILFGALIGIVLIFIMAGFIINYLDYQSYFTNRFNIGVLLNNGIEVDGSVFLRIVHPLIGVLQFKDFPLGYGGGFYYVHYYEYLLEYFPAGYVLGGSEMQDYFSGIRVPQAMSLFSRILAEEGIVLFGVFMYFIKTIYSKAKNAYSKFVVCLACAIVFNLSSYACIDFWLLLAAVHAGFFELQDRTMERRT